MVPRIALLVIPRLLMIIPAEDRDEGFRPLVTAVNPASAFDCVGITVDRVVFANEGFRLEGSPRGYLATKASYGDFTLRFEWKYDLADGQDLLRFEGNGGVLLRVAGREKVWPRSLQLQLAADDPGDLFGFESRFVGLLDTNARDRALKPLDRWNQAEIECRGTTVIARINGVQIISGTYDVAAGPIAFQSQGSPIRFRNVRILLPPPAKP